MFKFLKKYRNSFQSGHNILYFYSNVNDIVFPYPHQHLVSSLFYILVILVSVQSHFNVVLICSFLMANDVERLFMCLFAICVSSSVKCLFHNCLVCFFLLLNFTSPLLDTWFATIFSYSVPRLLILLAVFCRAKF